MAKPPLNGVAETEYTKSQKEERNSCLGDAETHAARMCQFSFEHLLSPRGDSCEHTAPTVRP